MNRQRSAFGLPVSGGRNHHAKGATPRINAHAVHVAMGEDAPATEPTPSTTPDATSVITQLLPVAKALLDTSATQNVEVTRAKIANYTAMRDRLPQGGAAWTLYNNRIVVLKAKLKAAQAAQNQEKRDLRSRGEWSTLGKGALVAGIGVGAALIALLVSRAVRGPTPRRYR